MCIPLYSVFTQYFTYLSLRRDPSFSPPGGKLVEVEGEIAGQSEDEIEKHR